MNIYKEKRYKKLFIIPIVFLLISLFFLTQLSYGMEFKGGSRITAPLENSVNAHEIEREASSKFNVQDLKVKQTQGLDRTLQVEYAGNKDIIRAEEALGSGDYEAAVSHARKITGDIETNKTGKERAREYISQAQEKFRSNFTSFFSQKIGLEEDEFSFNTIGASLGSRFLEQAKNAVFAALVLIAILVFFFFRRIVISLAVFQAAVYDILFGLGATGAFGITITLGTIAALLMLIGYSIDSDIMLTDRIMKRKKGNKEERAFEAMKTGLTMTGTTLGALSGLFIVSLLTNITILVNISLILIIGLIGDLITTWFANVPLVLWYMDRKGLK